jgi:hypothetical protein
LQKRNGGGKWKDVDENAQLPEDSDEESDEDEEEADEDGQEAGDDSEENEAAEDEGGNGDAEPPTLVDERGRPLKLSPAERAMLLQQLQRSRVQAAAKRQQKQNVRQLKRKAEGDAQEEEDDDEDGEDDADGDSSAEDDSDEEDENGQEEEGADDASEGKASIASEGIFFLFGHALPTFAVSNASYFTCRCRNCCFAAGFSLLS